MEAGALDWTKARELLRVSTPDTEAAWVARAQERTSRELEREVSATAFGAPPPEAGVPIVPGSQRGRLSLDGERSDIDTIRSAIAVHRARCGLDAEELDDCALLALLAMASIRAAEQADATEPAVEAEGSAPLSNIQEDDGATQANAPGSSSPSLPAEAGDVHAGDAQTPATETVARAWRDRGERYRVVIECCPKCRQSTSNGAEVSEDVLAHALCDHERVNALEGPDQGRATRAIAPRLRRMVFVRAKWRCEVPGCTNHLWLDVHHFTFVANGGRHVWWNLGVLCGAHHRAIHAGGLSIVCIPSGAIRVTHRDGRTCAGPEPTTHVGRGAA
jgi:hypothetical protein